MISNKLWIYCSKTSKTLTCFFDEIDESEDDLESFSRRDKGNGG